MTLEARGLTIERGGRDVLREVSLTVRTGEILAVLGPNGAGKSTLVDALAGERRAHRGDVLLQGRALKAWAGVTRARQLAVLPQQSRLDFGFRVDEVVGLGRLPHVTGAAHDAAVVRAALEAVDVLDLAERGYLELSGGERQRVHLARVLAQLWPGEAGQVLLLDEPTATLDPLHQLQILHTVRQLADRGVAVLVVLHDLNLAARYADCLVLLKQGQVHSEGRPDSVLQPSVLSDVFGVDVLVQPHPLHGYPLVISR